MTTEEDIDRILKMEGCGQTSAVPTWILVVATFALVIGLGVLAARCFDRDAYPAPDITTNGD